MRAGGAKGGGLEKKKARTSSSKTLAPRYVMVGGFLGAGKSTALGRFARYLSDRGLRVGLITNDQGSGLVDTLRLRAQGFAVEEIAGGCFCCRFDSLREAAERLTEADRPDVFLAEPVGSCTDLVATVSYPLRRIYGGRFTIAPLSVLIDPRRSFGIFGLRPGRTFSKKVSYIYEKQLEEAAVIAINKIDIVPEEDRRILRSVLEAKYPAARIVEVSALRGDGLMDWFRLVLEEGNNAGNVLEIDYDRYAAGEALLGWLNATLAVESECEIDAGAFLEELAVQIHSHLYKNGVEVAHLKMTLSPEAEEGRLAVVSLVGSGFVPELTQHLDAPVRAGQLIINLRAEGDPDLLRGVIEKAAGFRDRCPVTVLRIEHLESFRPGRPVPSYRLQA